MQPRFFLDDLVASHPSTQSKTALVDQWGELTYPELDALVSAFANQLESKRLSRGDRVAILLPKSCLCVVVMFACARAGLIFVPINPLLKARQIAHIVSDSGARLLVTAAEFSQQIADVHEGASILELQPEMIWGETVSITKTAGRERTGSDLTAILYTSGSTGNPKGVALSHQNIVTGALSVASYLQNTSDDRILALLPLSFDAGFSQLSSAFASGAAVYLQDFFFAKDVANTIETKKITGVTGVPPLWSKIARFDWEKNDTSSIRYFANTGGRMPTTLLGKLRSVFPNASPYLMYGLTEAFRSTYLEPELVDVKPDSIGKAIPNAEVLVVRPDGTICDDDEPGELIHLGPLVARGYWNDPTKTAEKFRPFRRPNCDGVPAEIAVWSGDTVTRDSDGYLYFVGREDEMIKSSGYRISPTDVEEIALASKLVDECVAFGVEDEDLGQQVVLVAVSANPDSPELTRFFVSECPAYMVPSQIHWTSSLPRNPNGKHDRTKIRGMFT